MVLIRGTVWRKKTEKKDKQHRRLTVQDSLVLSRLLSAMTSKNALHLLCSKFQRVTLLLQIKLANPCQLTTKYSFAQLNGHSVSGDEERTEVSTSITDSIYT